jgi:hypothetical protein
MRRRSFSCLGYLQHTPSACITITGPRSPGGEKDERLVLPPNPLTFLFTVSTTTSTDWGSEVRV